MPFIPHTEADVATMLSRIGAASIEDLFDEIPDSLRIERLAGVPDGMNEADVTRLMRARASQDGTPLNFAGAGAYEHHIPAAVWEIVTRGEFYSAYTPYQAEASQGTLQLIYEFQTMMTRLTGMAVSNASMYDGATALAESVLMAERTRKRDSRRRVLIPRAVHPAYRRVVQAIVAMQGIEIVEVPFDPKSGKTSVADCVAAAGEVEFTALVVPQPNFFGVIEDVDALTDWAHAQGALAIGVVNPTALALLREPGRWGAKGADIVCGEGQPLGVPLASGGPYFGFLCTRMELVRHMPGRIVGRTTDLDGREGFTLTLQAREQHIRRAKATSNICTNQGLLVTAATLYMSMLGTEGLRRVATLCAANARALRELLMATGAMTSHFDSPFFHEFAMTHPRGATALVEGLAEMGIVAGFALGEDYPEIGDALLVCATETKSVAELKIFSAAITRFTG